MQWIVGGSAFLTLDCITGHAKTRKKRPNILWIIAEDTCPDLGCYGNPWIKTPHLDKFADKSSVFEFAYSEGLATIPVRTALFTGRYTLPFRGWQGLEQNDITIAEILWDKGISSALICDTYQMQKPQMGFSRCFDYVQMIRGQEFDPWILESQVQVDLS